MKTMFILLSLCFSLLLSCRKSNNEPSVNTPNTKLKSILYPIDTVSALCVGCLPVISQGHEYFFYDNSGKLTSRIVTKTILSNNPVTTDTVATYLYSYSGSAITNYSETKNNITINHALTYDPQNRLLLDSVTNPQTSNNRVASFKYLQGIVVQNSRFSETGGTTHITDSMFYIGANLSFQKNKVIFPNGGVYNREMIFTLFPYQNPFSYANNFGLFASEYLAGVKAISFSIYTPQRIIFNLASQVDVKYWGTSQVVTQYSSIFTTVLDPSGRVKTVTDVTDRNRQTFYEYY